MLYLYNHQIFNKKLTEIYWKRFKRFGAIPEGSFWESENRQQLRFKVILDEIDKIFSIASVGLADVGCGYGALANYISENRIIEKYHYTGYDISSNLISECKSKITDKRFSFKVGSEPFSVTHCTIMSGTYNLAMTRDLELWEKYVLRCLIRCWQKTSKAMIFNLQVAANGWISKNNIYYAEKNRILELCLKHFGPTKLICHPKLPKDVTFVVLNERLIDIDG